MVAFRREIILLSFFFSFSSAALLCLQLSPCSPYATCSDGLISLTCTCNSGYVGNGQVCNPVDCGNPSLPSNSIWNPACTTTYPNSCIFQCNSGYRTVGSNSTTCQASGSWTSKGTCQAVTCPTYIPPLNSTLITSPCTAQYPNNCSFQCQNGFVLQGGPNTATCGAAQTWSATGTCAPVSCPVFPLPSNSTLNGNCDAHYPNICKFNCNSGYNLVGNNQASCGASGQWSSIGTCQAVDCGNFPLPNHASTDCNYTTYPHSCAFTCDSGYNLVGTNTSTCSAAGTWSNVGSCQAVDCGQYPTPVNSASLTCPDTHYPNTCSFQCLNNYVPILGLSTPQCNANGNWSFIGGCEAIACPINALSLPVNGSLAACDTSSIPNVCNVKCNAGFILSGANSSICQSNLTWTSVGTCNPVDCGPSLPQVTNGTLQTCIETHFPNSCGFTCDSGFNASGIATVSCLANGTWGFNSKCKAVNCGAVSLSANMSLDVCPNTRFPNACSVKCDQGYQINGLNSTTCQANATWSPFGTCQDINECMNGTICDPHANCTNTQGSFFCTCNSGFNGDGFLCNNINECADPLTNNCNASATCADTTGSYTCTCNSGFNGDGISCTDINECVSGGAQCDSRANCSNTIGSYQCICNSGYTALSNGTCIDIDECSQGIDNCNRFATCSNTIGSFHCTCDQGFNGNGSYCSDINECSDQLPEQCHGTGAVCTNTFGSFFCLCTNGFQLNATTSTCSPIYPVTPNVSIDAPISVYRTSAFQLKVNLSFPAEAQNASLYYNFSYGWQIDPEVPIPNIMWNESTFSLPAFFFNDSTTYRFGVVVTITTPYNQSIDIIQAVSINILASTLVAIIESPSSMTVGRSGSILLNGTQSFDPDYPTTQTSFSPSWSVLASAGGNDVTNLFSSTDLSSLLLSVPSSILSQPSLDYGLYTFTLSLSSSIYNTSRSTSTSTSIELIAIPTLSILSPSSFYVDKAFQLQASLNVPADLTLSYSYSYLWQIIPDVTIPNTLWTSSILSIPSLSLNVSTTYNFNVVVTITTPNNNVVSLNKSISVFILPSNPAIISGSNRINPDSTLRLSYESNVTNSSSDSQYQWTVFDSNNQPIDISQYYLSVPNSPGLVLNQGLFIAGHVYRVVGTFISSTFNLSAETNFTINIPPTPGTCQMNVLTGVSLLTNFTLTCSNWTDDKDSIFNYTFKYRTVVDKIFVLTQNTPQNSATFFLPSGNLQVGVQVFDQEGASTLAWFETISVAPFPGDNAQPVECTVDTLMKEYLNPSNTQNNTDQTFQSIQILMNMLSSSPSSPNSKLICNGVWVNMTVIEYRNYLINEFLSIIHPLSSNAATKKVTSAQTVSVLSNSGSLLIGSDSTFTTSTQIIQNLITLATPHASYSTDVLTLISDVLDSNPDCSQIEQLLALTLNLSSTAVQNTFTDELNEITSPHITSIATRTQTSTPLAISAQQQQLTMDQQFLASYGSAYVEVLVTKQSSIIQKCRQSKTDAPIGQVVSIDVKSVQDDGTIKAFSVVDGGAVVFTLPVEQDKIPPSQCGNDNYMAQLAPLCHWWDPATGEWSSSGCQTVGLLTLANGSEGIRCKCSHLTDFAAILRDQRGELCNTEELKTYTIFAVIYFFLGGIAFCQFLRVIFSHPSGATSDGWHVKVTMEPLTVQHFLVFTVCLTRSLSTGRFGHIFTLPPVGIALVTAIPYMVMFWLFSINIQQWGMIYHKRKDLGSISSGTVKHIQPYFIITNVTVSTTIFVLFLSVAFQFSSHAYIIVLVSSIILFVFYLSTSLLFVIYGGLLFQLLSKKQSEEEEKHLVARLCRCIGLQWSLPVKMMINAIIICTCFTTAGLMFLLSAIDLGTSSDGGEKSRIYTPIFLTFDLLALGATLGMYAKAIALREDELRESRSSRLSRSSRGETMATPKKVGLLRNLDGSQRGVRESDAVDGRSQRSNTTGTPEPQGPIMKRGPQSNSTLTDSLSESGSDRPGIQLSSLFVPPRGSTSASSPKRKHHKVGEKPRGSSSHSDFLATPSGPGRRVSLSDSGERKDREFSGSRTPNSPSHPRALEKIDQRGESVDLSLDVSAIVSASRVGPIDGFLDASSVPHTPTKENYSSGSSTPKSAARSRTISSVTQSLEDFNTLPAVAEKTESSDLTPGIILMPSTSSAIIDIPPSSSSSILELSVPKSKPKEEKEPERTEEPPPSKPAEKKTPTLATRLLSLAIPRSPKNDSPTTATLLAPSGKKATSPTHKKGASESGMFVL